MEPEPIAPSALSPTAAAGPSQQLPEQSEPREQEAVPTPAGTSITTKAAPAEAPEGKAIDLKAEADYLRRLNARNPTTTSRGSGKDNDLFGKEALESQMNSLVKEQGLTFDQDALTYLALAAESRLRSVLASTLSAQTHRTTTSHARTPPFTSSGKKPLWSHSVTSDPNAVLAAMAQANKEATQKYRAARVAEKNRLTLNQPFSAQPDDNLSDSNMNDPSTPMKSGSSGPSTPASASGERSSAPVFGAVKNKISSGKKKAPPPVKDLSADVQLKMSNATAMRSIGMSGRKQYSWMTSAPSISSPLANQGKKRKAGASENTPEPPEAGESPAPTPTDPIRKEHGDKRKKVKRPKLSAPTRREVVVSRDEKGEEKKVSDDRAVTLVDLLFALEKDGVGRGMGKTDDLVRKAWVLGGIEASKSETKSAHKR